jgi:hypothetical protein
MGLGWKEARALVSNPARGMDTCLGLCVVYDIV